MNSIQAPPHNRAFAVLRGLARNPVPPVSPVPLERCEMCSSRLAADHQHLVELVKQKLICACDACALLFSGKGATKYKRVPRRVLYLEDFSIVDAQWNGLMIPIDIAFFRHSTRDRKMIAMYPSPAGPTESLLSLEAWNEIAQENPVLNTMEPDVEALLVNRLGHARGYSAAAYYLLPIDRCYALTGLIRANWRGLSGGTEVWRQIGLFFEELKESGGVRRSPANA